MKILLSAVAFAAVCLAQGGFEGPGRYEIMNVGSGKVLDLDRNDQTTVIQFERRGTDNQMWDIQPAGPNVFYIRNAMNGRALEMTADSNSSPVQGRPGNNPNQHWRFEEGRDGSALLISRFGKAIDIPDGSNRNGVRVQVYDRNGDANQRFLLVRIGGRGLSGIRPGPGFETREPGRTFGDPSGKYFDNRDRMWKIPGDGVCFYRQRDFNGDALCVRSGDESADVLRDGGGSFLSMKFFGRARGAEVFERAAFRGQVLRLSRDESDLRRAGAVNFGSVRVQ